eukprot:PhF_6_TR9125/c0_g1_i1/m.14195
MFFLPVVLWMCNLVAFSWATFDDARIAGIYDLYPFLYNHRRSSFEHCGAQFESCEQYLAPLLNVKWHPYYEQCTQVYCSCLPNGRLSNEGICSYTRPSEDEMCSLIEYCIPTLDNCIRNFERFFPTECQAFLNCTHQKSVTESDEIECIKSRNEMYPRCDNTKTCSAHPVQTPTTTYFGTIFVILTLLSLLLILCIARYVMKYTYFRRHRQERPAPFDGDDEEMLVVYEPKRCVRNSSMNVCDKCKVAFEAEGQNENPTSKKGVWNVPCMCYLCPTCISTNTETTDMIDTASCPNCGVNTDGVVEKWFTQEHCIICHDASPTVMCAPCGHHCLCVSCSEFWKSDPCPICRGKILVLLQFEGVDLQSGST